MPVPTSALYLFTRDRLRSAGLESTFEEDARAALRAWASQPGRRCAVIFQSSARVMASLSWPAEGYDSGVWDFHRQCELFAIAWAPAAGDSSKG